jgi:hypothetical protein
MMHLHIVPRNTRRGLPLKPASDKPRRKVESPCELLLRARLVPQRAGLTPRPWSTSPLSQPRGLPGAADLEDAWLRARLGHDDYLAGKDAEAAACDAQVVPVVTGQPDPGTVDTMIALARTAAARPPRTSQAWQALRHAIARLAVDLVSGPAASPPPCARDYSSSPSTPPASRRTSATAAASPATSAAPSSSATGTARGPAATGPRCTATSTTCGTRPTAARPPSPTAPWPASS